MGDLEYHKMRNLYVFVAIKKKCWEDSIFLIVFQLKEYSQKAVEILRTQNHILTNHPNSNIYKWVTSDFDPFH